MFVLVSGHAADNRVSDRVFLKSSALVLALAICTAIPLSNSLTCSGGLRHWLLGCIKWGTVFSITYAVAHVAFNSRGGTPVSVAPKIADQAAEKGLFAVAAPLLSSVSFDDLVSVALSRPNRPLLPNWQERLVVILPLVLLACLAYYWVGKHYAGSRYGTVCLVILTVYVLVFTALNVLGSAVSSGTEARHYRCAGLVLLPGLLSVTLLHAPRTARSASSALVLAMCLYGLSSYLNKCIYLKKRNSVGTQGFTQLVMGRRALQWLIRADSDLPPSNGLFYLPYPELGLEVHQGRFILTHADFEGEAALSKKNILARWTTCLSCYR